MTKIAEEGIELLVETSWEVCNKIGGIYTVLSTKAKELQRIFGDRLLFIGPDVRRDENNPLFKERVTYFKSFASKKLPCGIRVRCGKWNIPGSPKVILVDYKEVFPHLNEVYGEMWEAFGVDSLHAYGDYDESCAFSVASAIVIQALARHLKIEENKVTAHFDEWTTGMGLLYLKRIMPAAATVFTTHATTIGRSICGNGKDLYRYFSGYNGDQMAGELNVQSKHSLEKAAAREADCFTTVSDVTARECAQLLDTCPAVVTPNGFEPSFVPGSEAYKTLRIKGRSKILKIASMLGRHIFAPDSCIVATSGRNEFRNKGLDLFLDSIARLADKNGLGKDVIALVLVPAWVKNPSSDLLTNLEFDGWIEPEPDYLTHRLHNEDSDAVACKIRSISSHKVSQDGKHIKIIYVPSYLDGGDGIFNISYYGLLPAIDLSIFASYYEPWGYTPLESIAFGVPTVTTDKAGFGQWAVSTGCDDLKENGVRVIRREDENYDESRDIITNTIVEYIGFDPADKTKARNGAAETSKKADWKFFISKYLEAYEIALKNSRNRISL